MEHHKNTLAIIKAFFVFLRLKNYNPKKALLWH